MTLPLPESYPSDTAEQSAAAVALVLTVKEKAMTTKEHLSIRRGDLVRLSDGQVVRVLSTRGGYIHTTTGTYGPWQLERLDKHPSCGAVGAPATAVPSSP
jgi:hypothetical protein